MVLTQPLYSVFFSFQNAILRMMLEKIQLATH